MDATGIDDPLRSSPPPRRRGAAVFVVLAVIAGFAGGFAAGYAAADDGDGGDDVTVAAIGPSGDAGSGSTSFASEGTAPTVVVTGVTGPGTPQMPTRERLFKRTSSAGHSVRVYRMQQPRIPQTGCDDEQTWCPPPQCFPTTHIEATAVGEWAVGQGGAAWLALPDDSPGVVLGTVSSWGDDEAIFGVIVRAAPDAQVVRFVSGDIVDEMAPIDEVAVLVVPGGQDGTLPIGWPRDARVEVVDASGATSEVGMAGPTTDPACIPPPPPPPTLPEPGDQPDDPAAAEAAVRQAVEDVFGPETPDALERLVDDPTGLAEARETLKERYPEQSKGESTYEVGELVFTSPTEAQFQFRAVIPNYATLPWQLGGARVVDGQWKLTRSTVCNLFRLGGVTCS